MSHQYRRYKSYEGLPEKYSELLGVAAEKGFFYDRPWIEFLMESYYSEESELCLVGVESAEDGVPLMLAPMRLTRSDGAVHGAKTLACVGHMENYSLISFIFSSAVASASERLNVLVPLMAALQGGCDQLSLDRIDVLRLWPAEKGSDLGGAVSSAMKQSGFYVQSYDNSYNQYEDTSGLSYADYFESRSSNHRYNVRRRQRNLEKRGCLEFRFCTKDNDMEVFQGLLDDYILASVVSWKEPGSMVSKGILDLIRLTASLGCMRLGVLYLDGRPLAAQFWVVSGSSASCLRLAYDEAYKKDAPGVVLTGFMIEKLLDEDHVAELDFGYGDDEYKKKWTKDSRYYAGYMGFNSRTWRGRYFALKHIAGRRLKWLLKKLVRG